ncbi:MAG: hypothetical protein PHH82_00890 [Candidatus ainarchaeum sp.]|nr:hypothetical protein [Candidatus ainarchaeum sp.]
MTISSGFGSKYGRKIRRKYDNVTQGYKFKKLVCPFCGMKKVTREASGIYECLYCKKKFAGGAYEVETRIGKTIRSSMAKKNVKELEVFLEEETKIEDKGEKEEKAEKEEKVDKKEKKQKKEKAKESEE